MNNYVLAMYDIRAKQKFIFKTNHMKEIIGASAIIRDCFDDYLYPQAGTIGKGIFHEPTGNQSPFTRESFEKHLEEGYIGEIVYDGGGNFLLLFKDIDVYKKVTYLFTREVMKEIGTLKVLGSCIEGVNFDNYAEDRRRLYSVHSQDENQESNIAPWATLPIVQVDRKTSMPLVGKWNTGAGQEKVSKESLAKYKKYDEEVEKAREKGTDLGTNQLEDLVTRKGEDSLLAIVYIDGNSMGAQVQECIRGKETYEECIAALRNFSVRIQKDYIDDRLESIREHLSKKANGGKWRLVLGAGDEVNFVCNAHDAFPLARAYLESLPEGCSSCAGIAVFHSHAPYADVYKIAEECCESGKKLMKRQGIKNACFIDYHYCQGAIDVSLERIRQAEANENTSLPWMISRDEKCELPEGKATLTEVENMLAFISLLGRSNVKGLAAVARESLAALKLDLKRIEAHMSDSDKERLKSLKGIDIDNLSEKQRHLIYDISTSYDLWFREE